tara:strand:- start:1249 stop:1551 length:303 start_codon:yes stop_codon:yes gene_type:complete
MSSKKTDNRLTNIEMDASIDVGTSNEAGGGTYRLLFISRLEDLIFLRDQLTSDAIRWVIAQRKWAETKSDFNFQVKDSIKLELRHIERFKRRRKNQRKDR